MGPGGFCLLHDVRGHQSSENGHDDCLHGVHHDGDHDVRYVSLFPLNLTPLRRLLRTGVQQEVLQSRFPSSLKNREDELEIGPFKRENSSSMYVC